MERLPVAEKTFAVIPGRREAASPESRKAEIPDILDSGLAPSARPGMTCWSFSAACYLALKIQFQIQPCSSRSTN
jgi:hypothetical protein